MSKLPLNFCDQCKPVLKDQSHEITIVGKLNQPQRLFNVRFHIYIYIYIYIYISTSGFWPRVRARALRAPVFLGSLPRPMERCAPLHPSQLRCSPQTKKTISRNKMSPSRPKLGPPGAYVFPLGDAAPYWATLYPRELRCPLVSYAVP